MTNGANRTDRDTEVVYKATALSGDQCYFGNGVLAKAWAGRGTVESVMVKPRSCELAYPNESMVSSLRLVSDTAQEQIKQLTTELEELKYDNATQDELLLQICQTLDDYPYLGSCADGVTKLMAENAKLRAALETIVKDDSHNPTLMVMIAIEALE